MSAETADCISDLYITFLWLLAAPDEIIKDASEV